MLILALCSQLAQATPDLETAATVENSDAQTDPQAELKSQLAVLEEKLAASQSAGAQSSEQLADKETLLTAIDTLLNQGSSSEQRQQAIRALAASDDPRVLSSFHVIMLADIDADRLAVLDGLQGMTVHPQTSVLVQQGLSSSVTTAPCSLY